MHSFTPEYEGTKRKLEVGVLYNRDEQLASALTKTLRTSGFLTELNEPYSGKAGMMYSVDRHARTHHREAVELEVRQDLAEDPERTAQLVHTLATFFS